MMKTCLIALLLFALAATAFASVGAVVNTVTVTADNGFTANGDGTFTTVNQVNNAIPTLSTVGLVTLAVLLAGFAVLRVRPSPFCVLDEVDAALDETNVDRYLTVLRDLSRETQMLVVTHNRATMSAADALYGLTIDETGASGVLSLRLESFIKAM